MTYSRTQLSDHNLTEPFQNKDVVKLQAPTACLVTLDTVTAGLEA